MKKLLFIFFLVFIIISCRVSKISFRRENIHVETDMIRMEREREMDTCRENLYKYVKDYWVRDTVRRLYYFEEGSKGVSVLPSMFPCLIGMDSSECKTLFGKPNKIKYNEYIYYYSHYCFDFETRIDVTCHFYCFYLAGGKVIDAQEGSMRTDQ